MSASQSTGHCGWPIPAIQCLISLYEEYQGEMEDPLKKKIRVFTKITEKLNNQIGSSYTVNQVQCKWNYLVRKYSKVKAENSKTGQARKDFPFAEELDRILSKRHDINPPIVSGNSVVAKVFSNPSKMEPEKPSETEPEMYDEETSDDFSAAGASRPTKRLSTSRAATRRRENRQKKKEMAEKVEEEDPIRVLIEMEKQKMEDRKKSEEAKAESRREKNDLLKAILNKLPDK